MKRPGKKQLRWLIPCLILLVGACVVVRYLSSPSQGTLTSSTSQSTTKRQLAQPPATVVESEYYRLTLPVGYKPQASQAAPGLLHSRTLLKPSATGSLIVSIGIKAMPEGGVSGDSSFRLRQQKPERYQLVNQAINGEIVHIANDAEAAAVAAFWPHGGYLATIAISSGLDNPVTDDNAAELKALQTLLAGWQWR